MENRVIYWDRYILFTSLLQLHHSFSTTVVPVVVRQTSYLSMEALQCGEASSESRRGETSLMTMPSHTINNFKI